MVTRTTLKRIDVGSAFRVGIILYAITAAIFGLIFVALQGLFLSGLSSLSRSYSSSYGSAYDMSSFLGMGLVGLCIFYGVLVVFAAISGGIQFAVGAFLYNLTANWIGGIKVDLERESDDLSLDDLTSKAKRGDL